MSNITFNSLKEYINKIGYITFSTNPKAPAWKIRVKVLDVKLAYGKPLFHVVPCDSNNTQPITKPSWVRNIKFENA